MQHSILNQVESLQDQCAPAALPQRKNTFVKSLHMNSDDSLPVEVVDSIQAQFDLVVPETGQNIRAALSEAVNRMIHNDFGQLLNALYRLDVSEEKVRTSVATARDRTAGDLIADLIISRQLEKYKSRKSFNSNAPIDDEEKW